MSLLCPWIIVDDFEEMLFSSKKDGGNEFDFNCARKFQRLLDDCEFLNVNAKGCFYTWRNGHGPRVSFGMPL